MPYPQWPGRPQEVEDERLDKVYIHVRPLACEEKEGKTVVTCHLVGNFSGSPVDLRFLIKFEGDKIASLEVIP